MYRSMLYQLSSIFLCFALFNQPILAESTSINTIQETSHGRSRCDCCGLLGEDFWSRQQMFGDWCGVRSKLAAHGIIADIQLTQFYQGVSSGGVEETFKYGGKLDYNVTFLGEKLGLWKGFTVIMHAETQYGKAIVGEAGSLALPNTNMLYPLPSQENTSITGLLLMQEINDRVTLAAGKINVVDLWTMVYPHTGHGIDGFMNLSSLSVGLPWLRFVNLSVNGGGLLVMKDKQIQGGLLVFDANNSTTTTGINNLFDKGYCTLGLWRFFTNWCGKPGSHLFAAGWSSRRYTSLDPSSWTFIPGQGGGLIPGLKSGAWAIAYYFDQVIWADCCDRDRNIRLFTGWSLSDGDPSFARWNGMASLEGYGLLRYRKQDRMGIAYFYTELSKDFRKLVKPVVKVEELQGVELYYNAAITPWYHMTADLQIVDNPDTTEDTAVVLGLRAKIDF